VETIAVTPRTNRRNFWAATTESITFALANQLTAASVVLPFVCIAFGGTPFAAALIYPVYIAANLLGTVIAPRLLGGRPPAHALSFILSLTAGIFAATGFAIAVLDPIWLNLLWVVAAILGVLSGMSSIAVVGVMSSALMQAQRATISVVQNTGGSILALTVATVLAVFFLDPDSKTGHLALIWAGVVAIAIAALALLPIRPITGAGVTLQRVSIRAALRSRPDKAHPWLRSFLATQSLFLCIALGTSFYTMHGAVLHGKTSGSLHTIVGVTAVGSLLFSALWTLSRRRATIRGLMLTAASLGVTSATVALVADFGSAEVIPLLSGIVIALSAAGGLATSSTRSTWMYQELDQDGDTAVIVFAQVVMGIVATIVGLVFSTFAHIDSIVPTWGMLVLSTYAVIHALRLPRTRVTGR
jgi:MFS family permease